ncbi:MAG: 7-cyano-7-deazaguanine synthase QueC [Euryarchaeota archaeon]|nr:7-cyano-7-deazaguanine synthase QueC [Euryarchaeota archaeon]
MSLPAAPKGHRAIALVSGGLDSAVAAAMARRAGWRLGALSFDYGQRHRRELESARRVARWLRAPHRTLRVDLRQIGGSALTTRAALEERGSAGAILRDPRIPNSYVPLRNTILLALAAAHAEVQGARGLVIGANAIDYSHYPDCRPEYYRALERALALGSRSGAEGRPLRILAPLLRMSKAQIVRAGARLGVPLGDTWSCYAGGRRACGRCDSCLLRLKGFREAGIEDPVR